MGGLNETVQFPSVEPTADRTEGYNSRQDYFISSCTVLHSRRIKPEVHIT